MIIPFNPATLRHTLNYHKLFAGMVTLDNVGFLTPAALTTYFITNAYESEGLTFYFVEGGSLIKFDHNDGEIDPEVCVVLSEYDARVLHERICLKYKNFISLEMVFDSFWDINNKLSITNLGYFIPEGIEMYLRNGELFSFDESIDTTLMSDLYVSTGSLLLFKEAYDNLMLTKKT